MNVDRIRKDVVRDAVDFLTENGEVGDIVGAFDAIRGASVEQVLDWYLQWNGIIGYTRDILGAVESLQAASE